MKTWRPASWSQQARRMCDLQVAYVNSGNALIEDTLRFFSTSYRAPSTNHHRQGGEEIRQTYESR